LKNPMIQKLNVVDTLETNYMPYAMSVIISRALPEIDGLKPSHRKILYTMYGMGLLKGSLTKSANIVGQTMRIHPHGDMAIYETMVRMAKGNESLLLPLVESKGNFGRAYSRDMACASPRYTEAKLMPVMTEFFAAINKDTVPFVPNYDNTMREPTLLPVTFPSILANPNQGIAVGMASNICSFNLKELCEATIRLIEGDEEGMVAALQAPDFPSGGELIKNHAEMKRIYETGQGGFTLRSVYKYHPKDGVIEITEIPYTTTIEAIMEKITTHIKAGKFREISDLRDETDLKGLKLTLDIKRNTDPDLLMARLFQQTPLQDTFSCNFNLIVKGQPKVLGVKAILAEWLLFRMETLSRQLIFERTEKENLLHLLKGLEIILLDIDKAIAIIRGTDKEKEVIPNLMEAFKIDSIQAEYVAEIKLRHLNREYLMKQTRHLKSLQKEIKDLTDQINSPDLQKKRIAADLERVADTYGTPRKTRIVSQDKVNDAAPVTMINDYKIKVFLSRDGYLKKIPITSLRGNYDYKLKPKDCLIQEIDGDNRSDLIMFSNRQKAYKLKLYELDDVKAGELGYYLPNLISMDDDEKIIYLVSTTDYSGLMLFAFKNGKMAKVPLNAYETKTNRKVLANAYGNPDLRDIRFMAEEQLLLAVSSINKVLLFDTSKVSLKTTRNAQGVQVMKPKKDSELVTVMTPDTASLEKPGYYKAKIPAIGTYLRKTDRLSKHEECIEEENISLLELIEPKEE
jgi:DNA gyrase subunit A